jgi:endonuclease I/V8-like Glu-specific endopeptidase
MPIDLRIAQEAANRWNERREIREQARSKIDAGRAVEADTPERVQKRLTRLAAAVIQEREQPAVPSLLESAALERVIGKSEFLGVNFLELALAVSRFVGRIHIRNSPGRTAGFGTGFMVSPRLLLTNNHVLDSPQSATHSEVEFDYEFDRNGRLRPVVIFKLDPDAFFLTSKELDYTLVAVAPRSLNGIDISRYSWTRLIEDQGKAILGDSLNIIQHPRGEAKQIVLRSNQVVDLFGDYAHYVTDTEPGSSGAPVYNDQWELVALHHSSVPKIANGNYLKKDGSVWKVGMDPDDLDCIANEGIRVSSLVNHVKNQALLPDQRKLRDEMLTLEPPNPLETAQTTIERPQPDRRAPNHDTGLIDDESATWTVPIEITVRVGRTRRGQPPVISVDRPRPLTDSKPGSKPVVTSPPEGAGQPAAAGEAEQTRREALAALEASSRREYYNEEEDAAARDEYYQDIAPAEDAAEFYQQLNQLLTDTHESPLNYKPSVHLYPWVDLHESRPMPNIRSVYSGQGFDPRELIEEDFRIDLERARIRESLFREAAFNSATLEAQLDLLEATLPYNCEHVVPQSWFNKKEPMRGDLHHLFACETACNSFRGNIPYWDFEDFEEAIREECGKREENRFEPSFGKGPVARATLYFLVRYPGEINDISKEYTQDRLDILLEWHRNFPVTRYEQHRNAAIQEKQGNRNPLIDFPEWADRIDFASGLG